MSRRRYEAYRDSGVEWLGEVPEHWRAVPLRHLLSEPLKYGANESADQDDPEQPRFVRITDIDNSGRLKDETFRSLPEEIARPYLLRDGDLLFARSGSVGRTFLYRETWGRCAYAGYLVRASPNQNVASSRFLSFFTYSTAYLSWVRSVAIQATIENVSAEKYARLAVPLPPIEEQRTIAAFLDRETAKVDALIEKKRLLIERIEEQRTALISRTVTRGLPPEAARAAGLDPSPRLKPSGVEWLGEVPEHWEPGRLSHFWTAIDCKHRTVGFVEDADGIPVVSIREVEGATVSLAGAKRTTPDEFAIMAEGERRPRLGDIIYSRNATVGRAALVTTDQAFCMGQDVCLIRPEGTHPPFAALLLQSRAVLEQAEAAMVGATFRRINVGEVKAFHIALPPLPEQIAIAEWLGAETRKYERLVEQCADGIERLEEYRTALITTAVTGKIDVRESAREEIAAG